MSIQILDRLLIARIQAGDQEAFVKLYDRYASAIFRYIYYRVSNTTVAEDLSSEVFLKFWSQLVQGANIKNIRSFLYKIAYNLVIDYYRSTEKAPLDLDQQVSQSDPKERGLDQNLQLKQEQKAVLAKIDQLPEMYRQVLLLRYVEGLSIKEVAQVISKSSGAVRTLVSRARKQLKQQYSDEDF